MITIKNIYKSFDEGRNYILKDISTVFEDSKVNLIIGQSGSGKTVLMKALLGLIEIDKGEVFYGDTMIKGVKLKKELLREIGMVFQGGALFDSMNVEENVMFPLKMFTSDPINIIKDKTNLILERVGLENSNYKRISEISGGMKRRVAIARAIILRPKYLLCDEPNSGLDPYISAVIDQLLYEITKEYGIVTIINTHDMNSVIEIGEKVVFIKDGFLKWEGSKENIYESNNKDLENFVFRRASFKKSKKNL